LPALNRLRLFGHGCEAFLQGWDVRILRARWRLNGGGMRGMVTGPLSAAAPQQTVRTY